MGEEKKIQIARRLKKQDEQRKKEGNEACQRQIKKRKMYRGREKGKDSQVPKERVKKSRRIHRWRCRLIFGQKI